MSHFTQENRKAINGLAKSKLASKICNDEPSCLQNIFFKKKSTCRLF